MELNASFYRRPRDVSARAAHWHDEEVCTLLERHGAAHCVTSSARLPGVFRATAPFG